MKILKRIGAFSSKAVPHTIDGQTFQFYPVRTRMILSGKFRDLIEPIVKAVGVLRLPIDPFPAKLTEDSGPDGSFLRVTEAPTVQMVDHQNAIRNNEMKAALDTLFSDQNSLSVGRLILDSLRDEVEGRPTDEQVMEFMEDDNMDVAVLYGFVVGFVKANAKVLGLDVDGDLGKRLKEIWTKFTTGQLAGTPETETPEDETESTESENESGRPTNLAAVTE